MSKAITTNAAPALEVNIDQQLVVLKAVLAAVLLPLTTYFLGFGFGFVGAAASGLTHGSCPELFTVATIIATAIGFGAISQVLRGKYNMILGQTTAIGIAQGICACMIAG